jgi:hypothetical protein
MYKKLEYLRKELSQLPNLAFACVDSDRNMSFPYVARE